MARYKAGNLDNRNLDSRITVVEGDETIFGIIATIKRRPDNVQILLADNETTLDLDPMQDVDIHISGMHGAMTDMARTMEAASMAGRRLVAV
jgi:hypothetical protein